MLKGIKCMVGRAAMAAAGVMAAVPAMAEGWTPAVTVDTAPVFTVAGIVITALGAIWAIRKVIKLVNRS